MPRRWPALAMLLLPSAVSAQGTVQMQDPRRPPPLERSERCEVWEGSVSGNDPTAQASMQLCAVDADRVRGVFLWSSLQSGWDRRAFEGEWSADRQALTLRDTHMIESHPMNGWMLCTADRYNLRRVVPTRLEGTYDSAGCSDHGTMSFTLRGEGEIAAAPPTEPPRATRPRAANGPRCACSAPGAAGRPDRWRAVALLVVAMRLSRRGGRRR